MMRYSGRPVSPSRDSSVRMPPSFRPPQDQVVGPLDPRADPGGPLHRAAHRHRRHPRGSHELRGHELRPQKDGEVHPLVRRGLKAPGHAAPSGALAVGHRHRAVGRPLQGLPLEVGVGGVHLLETAQVWAGDVSRQIPADLPLHQGVRRGHQAVALGLSGLDGIAVPAKAVHGLPHRRPADAQGAAELLPGAKCPGPLPQQRVHPLPAHGPPPFFPVRQYTIPPAVCKHLPLKGPSFSPNSTKKPPILPPFLEDGRPATPACPSRHSPPVLPGASPGRGPKRAAPPPDFLWQP